MARKLAKSDVSLLDKLTLSTQDWLRNLETLELLCDKNLVPYIDATSPIIRAIKLNNTHLKDSAVSVLDRIYTVILTGLDNKLDNFQLVILN